MKSEENSASKPKKAKSSAKRENTEADQGDETEDVVEKGPKEGSTESKLGVGKKRKVAAKNAGPSAETKKAKKSTRTK